MDLETTPAAPAKTRRRWPLIAAAGIAVVLLAFAAVLYVVGGDAGPSLAAAEQTCNRGRSGAELGDGGKTLIIDMKGGTPTEQVRGGMEPATMTCILDALKVPASVRQHIEGTRALDGRQTDSWGDFTASWTYHPDPGLAMTIEQK